MHLKQNVTKIQFKGMKNNLGSKKLFFYKNIGSKNTNMIFGQNRPIWTCCANFWTKSYFGHNFTMFSSVFWNMEFWDLKNLPKFKFSASKYVFMMKHIFFRNMSKQVKKFSRPKSATCTIFGSLISENSHFLASDHWFSMAKIWPEMAEFGRLWPGP